MIGYVFNLTMLYLNHRTQKTLLQRGPFAREPVLGRHGFLEFHLLPNSTLADGNLGQAAGHAGGT